MTNTIACGNIPHVPHRHSSVAEVRACWFQLEDDRTQAAAEAYAEGAWLRAAEAGTLETWAEEDRDRLIDLYGYGPPPGSRLF